MPIYRQSIIFFRYISDPYACDKYHIWHDDSYDHNEGLEVGVDKEVDSASAPNSHKVQQQQELAMQQQLNGDDEIQHQRQNQLWYQYQYHQCQF